MSCGRVIQPRAIKSCKRGCPCPIPSTRFLHQNQDLSQTLIQALDQNWPTESQLNSNETNQNDQIRFSYVAMLRMELCLSKSAFVKPLTRNLSKSTRDRRRSLGSSSRLPRLSQSGPCSVNKTLYPVSVTSSTTQPS